MSGARLTAVFGQLGLTQVRYVSPVRRGAARGLAGRVYAQVERDFGVLAPPVALHSPAPEVMAASWLMLREILVVAGDAGRTAKEAVAAAVSRGNTCPWCSTVHSSTFAGLSGSDGSDPGLRAIAAWAADSGTEQGALRRQPAFPAGQAPELTGTAVILHYFNRMVNVFLTEVPLPPGVPKMMLRPVMRMLGGGIQAAARQPHQPGASLDLLPAAALPRDVSWAAGRPVVADAIARACGAVETAADHAVPSPVRDIVMTELGNWHGEPRGPSRAWTDAPLAALPAAHRPAGRLALLTALASYQVDRKVVDEFRAGGASDAALIELTSWASLAAARRAGTWISAGVSAS